uniref:ABC transporter, periplasmic spermidine putrescine-binding protein PotD (TC 3.A.1.11.1) n=1 Tax=uncultured bacterium contig00032 TaxID=1181521 RepID=A0A806KFX4_9BACT|nr:ABC transporter, periplasmic spermidine putrescine-binding protein PotD (TC 3.A.1.11.1) [uncultured bacterium contig00032]
MEKTMEEKESPTMDAVQRKKQTSFMKTAELRVIFILSVLALGAMVLGGCDRKERLYIYNWTYYTPDSVIEKFEKEYNVKVIYDEFASNEDMYAKLKAGGSGYDIVFPSADYVSIMIHQNMLEKIDRSKIPNLVNIDPAVLAQTDYDPDMEYSVPYYFGAAGIIVNTARVPEFEQSWSIFAREDLRGRMTMLDDMREVMGDALAYLGYSVNTVNTAEIEEAKNLVNSLWKPNLVKFDAEAFGKGYANGDFWVVQGYPEVVFEEIADNGRLKNDTFFFIPKEGGPAYIDSMCILKGSKNIDLAHKFIDFIHRPEIYAEFADEFGFPATANIPARGYKTGEAWYSEEDLANVELKKDLGEYLEIYNNAWFDVIKVGE